MSGKLFAIVRREYLERVRTKAFLIGTILGPILMGVLMIVPMFAMRSGNKPLTVAVLDAEGSLQAPVEQALRDARFDDRARFEVRAAGAGPVEAREAGLKKAVMAGALDGYLLLPSDAVGASKATYFGRNVSNQIDLNVMQRKVGEVLTARRLTTAGLDPGRVKDLTKDLDLKRIRLSTEGEREDRGAAALFAIILMMILYTSILMWGQAVMTGVIEEKTSRVVEVVASGAAPTMLLAGKLLGVGGAGLTQFLVWAFSLLGVSLAAAGPISGGFQMPEITPLMLASFVMFFLLGFAFYASLYAAVGSAVNSVQEAQNFIFPIVIPLVLGLMFFPTILESPDSTLSTVLSLVPFLTPLLMFLRIVVMTPPWWQMALSVALTGATIAGIVWVAARIYRVGILMYGKRPTFPELVRWVRHS